MAVALLGSRSSLRRVGSTTHANSLVRGRRHSRRRLRWRLENDHGEAHRLSVVRRAAAARQPLLPALPLQAGPLAALAPDGGGVAGDAKFVAACGMAEQPLYGFAVIPDAGQRWTPAPTAAKEIDHGEAHRLSVVPKAAAARQPLLPALPLQARPLAALAPDGGGVAGDAEVRRGLRRQYPSYGAAAILDAGQQSDAGSDGG